MNIQTKIILKQILLLIRELKSNLVSEHLHQKKKMKMIQMINKKRKNY